MTTSNQPQQVQRFLTVLLEARKLDADRIETTPDQVAIIYLRDKEVSRLPFEQEDGFVSMIQERLFYWPDTGDDVFASNAHKTPRILFAPRSPFRIHAAVQINTTAKTVVFSNIQWNGQRAITEIITSSPAHREAILSAARAKTGLVIANREGQHSIDGTAVLLALRPDALYFDGQNQNSLERAIADSANHLCVVGVKEAEAVAALQNLLGQTTDDQRQAVTERLLLSYVHKRVRRSCQSCAKATSVVRSTVANLPPQLLERLPDSYLFGRGCQRCGSSAYRGTVGLESAAEVTPAVRELLAQDSNIEAIVAQCHSQGTRSLLEDGLEKIFAGKTSFEEVFRIAPQLPPSYRPALQRSEPVPAATAAAAAAQPTADPSKPLRVLIVEDDQSQRTVLEHVFETGGFSVQLAENGKVGLQSLTNEVVDIVVCDVMMPEMDGITFLKEIRSRSEFRELPVLMLTAGDNVDDEYTLLTYGADDYCSKSIPRKILLKRVERLVRHKRIANPLLHMLNDQ